MLKRRHYIAWAVVVLSALMVLNLPTQTAAHLKLAIGSLFLPLFGLAGSTQQLAERTGNALVPRSELLSQIEGLRRQNAELRLMATQAQETARENARLRQFLGWQHPAAWKPKLAKVVLREPANWWRSVQIDLGSRDGVRVNLPVLTTEGLVGRIASVSLASSRVVLLGDPNCKVAARVENEGRDAGIIGAGGPLQTEFVELGYLSKNASVKPGQNVITSGEGGIFPKGILIGKIVDAHPVEYGLLNEARVKLAANLNALEEVWVLFQ